MELSKWFAMLLPEQAEFIKNGRGISLFHLISDQTLEFEYDLDDGFFAYTNGEFYIHEEEIEWRQWLEEMQAHDVERIVILDGKGDVVYSDIAMDKIPVPEGYIDTPPTVKYHGLDILNVMLPYYLFRELEDRLNGEILNENESKELCVLSLSASAIKDGEWNVGDGEEDNEEELVEQLEKLMIWLRWKVQMLPQVTEVRIAVWN